MTLRLKLGLGLEDQIKRLGMTECDCDANKNLYVIDRLKYDRKINCETGIIYIFSLHKKFSFHKLVPNLLKKGSVNETDGILLSD